MDPVSLIVAAVIAGASAALKETAGVAIKDAYQGLKSLLRRKFHGDRALEATLEEIDRDPETWKKPLDRKLREAKAGDDEEVVRAAQELLGRIDPDGAQRGKYNVSISGGKGIVVGDHAQVTQTFNED